MRKLVETMYTHERIYIYIYTHVHTTYALVTRARTINQQKNKTCHGHTSRAVLLLYRTRSYDDSRVLERKFVRERRLARRPAYRAIPPSSLSFFHRKHEKTGNNISTRLHRVARKTRRIASRVAYFKSTAPRR